MKKKFLGRLLTMLLVAAMVFTLLPASAIAAAEWWGGDEYVDDTATQATDDYKYNIFFLDCGRKYYSVDSIKQFIDNASAAGFNYIQLAVGNDGLRFLLNDMSLTVGDNIYESEAVKSAIHKGNEAYYNFDVDELTQSEMDTIIDYANSKGMGVIPCVNTPGHMDAILDAAEALTGKTCSYNGSARTIDVTNPTAVAFTQALLQKYITYFAGKGCQLFNMGADEYANDKYTGGSMGFGNLQSTGKYSYYVDYVNQVAMMIDNSGMTPMAFNDGIYFNNNTSSGTFNTKIIICYWSNGWDGYTPMPATTLANMGFSLINTHGSYYWVLGKSDWQCSASKASGFSYKEFQGSTIDKPAGSMFCVWADYPGAETEASVIRKTSATIAAFGKTLPAVSSVIPEPGITITPSDGTVSGSTKLDSANETASVTLSASEVVTWTWDPTLVNLVSADNTVNTYAATESLSAKSVIVTPVAGASGDAVITVTGDNGKTTDYTIAVYDSSAPVIADTITITVGGTATRTFTGDVRDTLKKDDLVESTATVSAEYKKVSGGKKPVLDGKQTMPSSQNETATGVISDGTNYLVIETDGTISNTTKITEATTFAVTKTNRYGTSQYTIKGNGWFLNADREFDLSNYSYVYKLSVSSSSYTWTYNTTSGFKYSDYYLTFSNDGWTVSSSGSNGFLYSTKEVDDTPVYKTVVTFTGVAAGTTYVTIDGKLYKIVVTDKAPDDAMTDDSIKLEYWITNEQVYNDQNKSASNMSITTATTGATTDNGIAIADIAPNPAYSFFDGTVTVYYWQAMRLDADNLQTSTSGDDETADGTTLTHIRYHGGAWQYKTADGIWHYFQSTDQLVAYYLQKTEVTEEIDTYVKDWGYTTDGTTPDTSSSKGQVALTVAVVYPDGTVSPAEGSMYANSTSIFNYWNSRDIGIVAPTNNSDYTISKITVTDGKRDSNSSANVWYTSDSITWDKKDLEDGTSKWYDETVVWDKDTNAGTTPMVNGKASNITWSAKNTAKLVLIYLETVQKETNLNVVYYNDNDKENIASMQVAMTYNQGDTEPTYANSLYLYGTVNADGTVTDGTLIAENKSSWSSNVVGDAEYLPDAAYVVNAANKAQTFSKTLSTIPGVAAKYKSGVYQYISADISSDGKTLTLHYAINASKLDKKYIFDFGLPIEIPLSELVENYDDIEYLSVDGTNLFENSVKTAHGTLSYDSSSKSIVFTLDKTVDTQAPLTGSFRVKYTNATELSKAITIALIPASNVLYEENFLTKADGWTLDTTTSLAASTAQETQKVGDTTGTTYNVFGYDNAYKTKTNASGVLKADGLTTTTKTGALTTSFYGNAFDLIGNCEPNSGRVILYVSGNGTSRLIDIDTRYNGGTISQVPLAHIELGKADATYDIAVYASGLKATGSKAAGSYSTQSVMRASSTDPVLQSLLNTYGLTMADVEYVSMSASTASAVSSIATYATAATVDHQKGTHVEIDGFRVYRSTTDDVANNYPGNEQGVTYQNILDVVKDTITAYTENEGNKTVSVEDYEAAGGPQNEIYLGEGQSVTFSVGTKQTAIQVSLRAVNGTAQWATSDRAAAGEIKDITSNTEMYYEVTSDANGSVTIANRGNTLLAIGNVKLPAGVSTKSASEMDKTAVYESVCAAFATSLPVDPEPDQTVFVPEHFSIRNYATPLFRHKLVTLRIDFSKDVSYVEIDGQKYYPSKFASWFGYYTVTFTDTIGRNDNYFYKVVFFDANGNPSETQSVYGK